MAHHGELNSCTGGKVQVVDYKGNPVDKTKTGGWLRALLILGIELCERLTTLSIAVNLVTYLVNTMHLPSPQSANIVTNFLGTSFILCLFGGFLADSFLGRYLTIAIFATVQALGIGVLTISTTLPQLSPPPCIHNQDCQAADGAQLAVLYVALYLIALGTGGLKSSVSGFGVDQFDENDEKERSHMDYFFNRFFFCISLGSLLAVTVLVYIQDNVGRSWGYGICASCMLLAIIIFLGGTRKYRFKKTTSGSPLVQIAQVFVAASRNRKLKLPADDSHLYDDAGPTSPSHRRTPHTHQFRFLDRAAIVDLSMEEASYSSPWRLCPVRRVEEVKTIIRMLPIWATTIMFWTTYAQMVTFSVEQASTMKRNMGKNFEIPGGSLTVFFVGAILLTLAFYDRLIMPLARGWTGKQGGFTTLQKIGFGLALSALAMAAAALTEMKRLDEVKHHHLWDKPKSTIPMSVFYLIPQFFLVGAGEAFVYTGQLDFFIRESPDGMKTMSTGLFLTTLALGFFLSSLLVSIVNHVTMTHSKQGWLSDNLNRGRLDNFYWLVALMSLLNLVAYLIFANRYTYKETRNSTQGKPSTDNGEGLQLAKSTSAEKECVEGSI
ncbi:hypothetical protein SUGI_0628050 [Cryptomeria japonica]|uniref:protein NRT1/ PTR FAMILY 6.2 n=1 Tax=Cryptomeria japonica TaxID=3369 RepID=UPI0024146B3D|nr:protein NRT1/ PTR FAMILY 6.2 [Cryptomeria japonica]GLJ31307.1 hypothetical protein SUGI_0628050 [Cryptomeria japonica]